MIVTNPQGTLLSEALQNSDRKSAPEQIRKSRRLMTTFQSVALALLLASSVVSGFSPAASAPRVVRAAVVAVRLPSRGSLLAAHFDVGLHVGALGAEEGLAYALKRLVRRTPSHTVTGVTGSRDWRGVFDSLTGDLADTVSIHALRDVTYAIAGPRRLRRSEASASELESVISRFDTNQDGSLTFSEYAPRSTTTPITSPSTDLAPHAPSIHAHARPSSRVSGSRTCSWQCAARARALHDAQPL